jgi:predicted transcriptional regulator
MRPPVPSKLGEQEFQILRYIAQHPAMTAGEVAEHFASTRSVARTTVATMMERLRQKRYLVRKKVDGVYRYSSRLSYSALLQSLMRDFVDRVMGGSPVPFIAYLVEHSNLTEKQAENLSQIIREIGDSAEGRTR